MPPPPPPFSRCAALAASCTRVHPLAVALFMWRSACALQVQCGLGSQPRGPSCHMWGRGGTRVVQVKTITSNWRYNEESLRLTTAMPTLG